MKDPILEKLGLERFKETVLLHPPLHNEELREMLRTMVRLHVQEESVDHENDDGPLVGVSPCNLISMAYELLARRIAAGQIPEASAPEPGNVEVVQ